MSPIYPEFHREFFALNQSVPLGKLRRDLNDQAFLNKPPKGFKPFTQDCSLLTTTLQEWGIFSNQLQTASINKSHEARLKQNLGIIYQKICTALELQPFSIDHKNWMHFFTTFLPNKFAELGLLININFSSPPSKLHGEWILPIITSVDKIIRCTLANIEVLDGSKVNTQVCEISDIGLPSHPARAFANQGTIFLKNNRMQAFLEEHKQFFASLDSVQSNPSCTDTLKALISSYKKIPQPQSLEIWSKSMQKHEAQHISDFNSEHAKLIIYDPNQNSPRIKMFSEFRPRINQFDKDITSAYLLELIRIMTLTSMSDQRRPSDALITIGPDLLILVSLVKEISNNPTNFGITIDSQSDQSTILQICGQLDKLIDHPEECRKALSKIANSPEQLYQETGVKSPDQFFVDLVQQAPIKVFTELASKI